MASLSIAPVGEVEPVYKRQIPVSKPSRASQLESEERKEYISLCEEIGYTNCTDLTREKLKAVLHEENIHVYDGNDVVKYLDQELGNDWEWRGLRQVDVDHLVGHSMTSSRLVPFSKEPYRGAIPVPVLLTIRKVQKAVPEVFFYISAPKGNDGDPFLMVTNKWLGCYIIERWNEPGFRESK